jgi:formiminotetrahydrofolate cyclodeaminase
MGTQDLEQRSIRALVEAIASEHVSPGSGSAAALALALGAACAGKAAAISLKHYPDRPALQAARAELERIAARALAGAREDADRFARFVHDHDPKSGAQLLRTGESLEHTAERLQRLIGELEPLIAEVVRADIGAARALCGAFLTIERANLRENRATVREERQPAGKPD